ncbi:MAG: sensor histidine kinase [Marmoricola sp.]
MPRGRSARILGELITPGADPRPFQVAFCVPVLVDAAFRLLHAFPDALGWPAAIGWVLIGAATAAAFVKPLRTPSAAVWIPVVDMAALGVLRLTTGSAVALALAFPAIWLGLQLRRRGVVLALVATASTMLLPGLAQVGINGTTLSRAVLMLLTILLCAGTAAVASQAWARQRAVLEQARADAEAATAELRVQRRLQEAVLTSADVGLASMDAQGRLTSVNPRQQQFLDLARPYGDDGPAFVFGPDGNTPVLEHEDPFRRAAAGEEFEESLIWVGADGPARRALVVSARSLDDAGRFAGAVLACHDVTDLLTAMRMRDEFVTTVSHELRTPITNIVGYLDLVLSDVEGMPEDARPFLETAARNGQRLVRLVSDLLQVGDRDDAAHVLEREQVDLRELVLASSEAAVMAAAAAGVRLGCEVDGHATVLGDPRGLRQLVDNLVSNAVKFSDAGGRVLLRSTVQGDEAVVTVSDTGIGIAPDEVEHLFTRFFRTRAAHRLSVQGVGLGLAICKDIAEAHGGSITVHSQEGVGSEFVVRLPAQVTSTLPVAG